MSRLDHETTDLASAAEFDRLNTPGPGRRDDWPDPWDCVGSTGVEADEDFLAWTHEAALRADRMLRGLTWRRS